MKRSRPVDSSTRLGRSLASCAAAIGVLFPFASAPAADFVGFVGEGTTVSTAGGDRYVIDVYAEFAQSTVNVVNLYDSSISNTNGTAFSHSDLNTIQSLAGTWSPVSSIAVGGANPAVDTFVTIGGSPGSNNSTTLDPTFSPATASVPPANAGWYNSSPLNGDGVADPSTNRVLVGRFVTATPGDTLNFSAWVTFADYVGGVNGTAQQVQGSVSIPYTTVACDTLLANAASTSIDAGGTSSAVSVSVDVADATCDWSATSDSAWLTLTAASGTGDGAFTFSVAENTDTSPRSGTITVSSGTASDASITVTQAGVFGCGFAVSPSQREISFIGSLYGGSWSFDVSADASCSWTAAPAAGSSWVTVTSGATGTGTGRVTYTVEPNFFLPQRTATIEIRNAGELVATHAVVQAQPAAECSGAVEFDSSSLALGPAENVNTVNVTTNGVTCAWYASTQASWITIQNGGSFTGDGPVTFTVAANATVSARTGTISIGSGASQRTLTIEQGGICAGLAATPGERYVPFLGSIYGETYDFAIADGGSGCSWTLEVDAGSPAWITVSSPTSGSGSATVTYSADINLYASSRSGTISVVVSGVTVATHTVTQAGPAVECTDPVVFSPSSKAVGAAGESFEVAVSTNGATCAWYAESNDAWITITNGDAFTGDGTMSVTVAENAGSGSRTGTINIGNGAGLSTFTISQAGTSGSSCDVLAANAASTSVPAAGTSSPVSVSVTVGASSCGWSAISNAGWISVSPGSGTGSGSFTYSASENASVLSRTATLTVASGTAIPVSITINQSGDPCAADSDGDGTNDCIDGCPSDPNKTEPGICGCGVSDAGATAWYPDADNDGYGDENASATMACSQPSGYVANNGDCDDSNPSINPGAAEVCDNGVDDDCDGSTDEGCEVACDTLSASAAQTSVPAAGTSSALNVTVTVAASGCTWSASSGAGWLVVSSGSGTGNGSFGVSASENLSSASRQATVTVSSGTASPVEITFTQSGYQDCADPETATPRTADATADAGSGTVEITTPTGTCAWDATVTTGSEWLAITSGGSGLGSGTIAYSYTENTGTEPRSGVITLTGGGTFTLTQAGSGSECPPWSPDLLDSLVGWWKADAITGVPDGGLVSVFPDQTENAINLAGTASLDADGLNGMATLRLASNFQSSGASVFSGVTSMVIMQVVRSAGNPSAYVKTSNNSSRLLLQDLGTTWRTLLSLPDSTINSISAIPFQSDVFEIASARAIGDSGATTPVVRVNGIDGTGNGLAVTGFASAPHFVGMNKSTGITEVAELVIIASNTDDANFITVVQMLEGYLAHKWGLTSNLPPSHPYRDTPPASGDCTPELVIDPDSTVIPPHGSQSATTVGVSSGQGGSVSWSAASNQDWLTLVDAVGEGSFDSFGFVAGMNPGSTPRTAVVTVTADNGASGSFEVMQQAPCELAGTYDCDNDGLLDTCAIMWGVVIDGNSNGIPDSCETSCPGDVNGNGLVDGADLAAVLGSWGLSGASTADCNQDGFVDGTDLAIVLGDWGGSCFEPRDPR